MARGLRAALSPAIIVASAWLTAGPAAAHGVIAIAATLDGRPATVLEASRHHCVATPTSHLTCFTNSSDRDQAVAGSFSSLSASATGYVIAYADATYFGASVVLSQNFTNLGTIGWSDRISSYKVYTSQTGFFYQGTSYTGAYQSYCCFAQVPYVGNAFNDTFSSFELP